MVSVLVHFLTLQLESKITAELVTLKKEIETMNEVHQSTCLWLV